MMLVVGGWAVMLVGKQASVVGIGNWAGASTCSLVNTGGRVKRVGLHASACLCQPGCFEAQAKMVMPLRFVPLGLKKCILVLKTGHG